MNVPDKARCIPWRRCQLILLWLQQLHFEHIQTLLLLGGNGQEAEQWVRHQLFCALWMVPRGTACAVLSSPHLRQSKRGGGKTLRILAFIVQRDMLNRSSKVTLKCAYHSPLVLVAVCPATGVIQTHVIFPITSEQHFWDREAVYTATGFG